MLRITKNNNITPNVKTDNLSRAGCLLAAFVISGMLFPTDGHATKKVYSPYVEKGELELEYRGGRVFDDDADKDGKQKHKVAVGYGVTDRWFTEVYGELEKSGAAGSAFEFAALEWENRFQIFEPGERWLDLGFYAAYEISLEEDHADKAEVKMLLAKDTGKFTHLANLILEKQIGAHSDEGTEAGIAWSSRYRYSHLIEPGFEIHSNFGELSENKSFDEQSHQAGPVFYGSLPGGFHYDIGYLFGLSDGAPDGELKSIIEYEMYF